MRCPRETRVEPTGGRVAAGPAVAPVPARKPTFLFLEIRADMLAPAQAIHQGKGGGRRHGGRRESRGGAEAVHWLFLASFKASSGALSLRHGLFRAHRRTDRRGGPFVRP